jgi:hypothetical protein
VSAHAYNAGHAPAPCSHDAKVGGELVFGYVGQDERAVLRATFGGTVRLREREHAFDYGRTGEYLWWHVEEASTSLRPNMSHICCLEPSARTCTTMSL